MSLKTCFRKNLHPHQEPKLHHSKISGKQINNPRNKCKLQLGISWTNKQDTFWTLVT